MTAPISATGAPVCADPDTIREYLSFYAGRPGLLSVCSDADGWSGRRFSTDQPGLTAATEYALRLDRRKPKGVYVQVTTLREAPSEGRGGEDLAHCLTYVWADGDYGTIGHKPGLDDLPHPADADTIRAIVTEAIPLEPTLWVHSGGGLNPSWAIEPHIISNTEDRARIKQFTADWQNILGATAYKHGFTWDTGIGNLDRLTRLIGTVNGKAEPFRPTAILGGSGVIYDLQQLLHIAERLAPEANTLMEQAAKEKQTRKAHRTKQPNQEAPRPSIARQHTGDGPLDVLADKLLFRDILEPAGFTYRGNHSDGREKWLRPAGSGGEASSEYSLLCDDHVAINWSERSDLPVGALAPGHKLTKGHLYALLNYNGNRSTAAKDILRSAAGRPTHGPAGALPHSVLDEVRRRCLPAVPAVATEAPDHDWADLGSLDTEPGDEDPEPEQDEPRAPRRPRGLLPEEFWASRLELQRIRDGAHSRNRSGDVAFYAVMTRLSGMVSHHIMADTGVANHVSLNLFAAIVGPSGAGKSTGVSVAERLLPAPTDLDFRDGLPIGSGEGVAEVFMDTVEEPTGEVRRGGLPITKSMRRQVRHNAFFYVDEGATLTRLMKERSGSTLGETLRSSAVGQTLGQTNASKDSSRYIPGGSYSMGLLVGFQPETAAPLFDDTAEGTPQRFLWGVVADPSIPDERCDWPGQLTAYQRIIGATSKTLITFDPVITEALWRADLARARGDAPPEESNPLDAHAPLSRIKVSSLLAVLAGRLHVTTEDWRLAEMVWAASCEARNTVMEYAARQQAAEAERRTQARIMEEVRVEHAKVVAQDQRQDKAIERVARRIAMHVHENGPSLRKPLREKTAGRDKKHLHDAIEYCVLRQWVNEVDGKLTPGSSRPS